MRLQGAIVKSAKWREASESESESGSESKLADVHGENPEVAVSIVASIEVVLGLVKHPVEKHVD